MGDKPEILVGTRGIAAVARLYAEKVLAGTIDGDDTGFAVSDTVKVYARRVRQAHMVGLEFVLSDSSDTITINNREARRVFAFIHGCLSVEFDETLPEPKTEPDFAKALDLLRTAQGVMDEPSDIEGSQEWFDETDALLSKYPQGSKP